MRIVLFIPFLVSVFADTKWDIPQKLEPLTNTSIGLSLFMTPLNSSFVLYSRLEQINKTQELGVKTFDFASKSLGNFTKLSSDRLYFTADIKGSIDGEQLLVAESASRVKVNEVLGKNSSVYDIFLLRSSDSGKNWTEEASIEKNDTVSVAKVYPEIVAVEELGQMYLFYINYYENKSETLVNAKYDPEASTGIAEEVVVMEGSIISYAAGYTFMNESLLLHIAFVDDKQRVMYTNSADGKTWKEPIQVGNATNNTEASPLVVLGSDPKSLPESLFLAYIGSDNKAYLRVSNDLGQNWTKPIIAGKKSVDSIELAVCGDKEDQAAFVLTSTAGKLSLRMYDVKDRDMDSIKAPFKKQGIMRPHIKCQKKEDYELIVLGTDYKDLVAYITTAQIDD